MQREKRGTLPLDEDGFDKLSPERQSAIASAAIETFGKGSYKEA